MDNGILQKINDRITIKGSFLSREILDETLNKLLSAGIRAPNASNMQRYSIIVIRDKEKQKAIGGYTSSIILVFCVDLNRWIKIFETMDISIPFSGIMQLLTGFVDASLCAQNIVIAAHSLGIGSRFTNALFRTGEIEKIFKILNLPKFVFPVISLCLGYPKEWPKNKKSRILNGVVHYEAYQDFSKQETLSQIQEYNSKNYIGIIPSEKIKDSLKTYLELYVKLQQKRTPKPKKQREIYSSLVNSGFLSLEQNGF
jgi:nitroreductase